MTGYKQREDGFGYGVTNNEQLLWEDYLAQNLEKNLVRKDLDERYNDRIDKLRRKGLDVANKWGRERIDTLKNSITRL